MPQRLDDEPDVAEIIAWLQASAPDAATPMAVLEGFAARLVAAGIPLHRVNVFVRTLHPDIFGRAFTWREGQPVVVTEIDYAILEKPEYLVNPMPTVIRSRAPVRRRLIDPDTPDDYRILADMRDEGITDYVAEPVVFSNDEVHVATFTTRAPAGFTAGHIAAIESVLAPFARVAEIYALRRTATTLLDTYVGRSAGERILSGQIRRGHTEEIDAAIWFSDLRDFTALADELPGATLIALMNDYFDRMVNAIDAQRGEVLKFIGDGLLAIFPLSGTRDRRGACEAALAAARDSALRMAEIAHTKPDGQPIPVSFRLALHLGRVLYGNVGGARRLDFTAMGPAVNLASRLERLASELGRSPIVSAEFAQACGETLEPLGAHNLRGVREPQLVFGLPQSAARAPVPAR